MQLFCDIISKMSGAMEGFKIRLGHQVDRLISFRINPSDTLMVSGFPRSGTTWLQQSLAELLQAKTIFEPLDPAVPDMRAIYMSDRLSPEDVDFLRLYMPYCGASTLNGHPLETVFFNGLRGTIRGRWVRRYRRNGVAEAFRPRVVLKDVKAHLCLRAAQNTFSMPVIHIYRDPRAIAASIKMTKWSWIFDHLSLREQLLEPQDGRAAFFGHWHADICEYDKEDKLAKIIAYWALAEKFLEHCYADQRGRIVFLSYEELCQKREQILLEALNKLGVRHASRMNSRALDVNSSTTVKQRRGASVEERIAGWKEVLSVSEVSRIESIVQNFGFERRMWNGG